MRIERYRKTRYWAVREADGTLLCLCVYKRGAAEVVKRLHELDNAAVADQNGHAEDLGWRCHRQVSHVVRQTGSVRQTLPASHTWDMLVLDAARQEMKDNSQVN